MRITCPMFFYTNCCVLFEKTNPMNEKDLKNKTSEELKSELKTIKTTTSALIVVLSLLFVVTIYGLITVENKTTFIALIAVAISCSAMLPLQFSAMKKIKAVLEIRKDR